MKVRVGPKAILVITYAVGVVGIAWPTSRALTLALTPVHLLLSAALVLRAAQPQLRTWWPWALSVVALGYGLELVGVHTGLPFGWYGYGAALGPKFWAVPPVIGVNWLLLVLAGAEVARRLAHHRALQILLGAAVMVALDALIEPLAPRLGFWQFWGGVAPPQNYLGWLAASLAFQWGHAQYVPSYRNPLALWLVGLMSAFFVLLRVWV